MLGNRCSAAFPAHSTVRSISPRTRWFAYHPGKGVTCLVDGKFTIAGSRAFLREMGVPFTQPSPHVEALSEVAVAQAGRLLGFIFIADTLRGDANKAVGHLFRPVNRGDQVCGDRMSEKVVWQMLQPYAATAGVPQIAPHDLRRTTAKLCRAAGGELEQIQLLLGHSSVQTTERYLGTRQDLAHAPNDAIKLRLGA